jgi:SAM-dependent methyltransferase
MAREIRAWLLVCGALAVGLVAGARLLAGRVPDFERPGIGIALAEAAGLVLVALVAGIAARPLSRTLGAETVASAEVVRNRPQATLFLISFVALFVELMLIRYCNSQIRIFSFYKNVPLIGCYLGLGLGCCLSRGTPRHAFSFLTWNVPLAVFLSAGSMVTGNALAVLGATASSEHILGDFVPTPADAQRELLSQVLMAAFCVATLVVITLLFALLGRLLGEALERVPRLPGYTVNIVGSLAGMLAFAGLSYLQTPPWVWFAVGLLPLLWWLTERRQVVVALGLIAASVAAVFPSHGETVWSRYQKLVGHTLPPLSGAPADTSPYLVQISDVFYQIAVDRRPETLARTGRDPYPHYDAMFAAAGSPKRVLVVGAGTGNDVAAALRAGAEHVDAVDIDPAIVEMGRRHHPERPYDDPRVRVIVDDARHAFRRLPPESYDAVVFGLLDSHTQLGMSSLRLDNYVFTLESLRASARLVKPGGHVIVTAATFRPWFARRFETMLQAALGSPVATAQFGAWRTYVAPVQGRRAESDPNKGPAARAAIPTDDWPFLYLPVKAVPVAYLWVVAALAVASFVVLRLKGLDFARFDHRHRHLFFLGAAFLLMEVHAINRLALLFGTTWVVSAVAIAIVLVLITCANFTVLAWGSVPYALAYTGLAASLAAAWWVDPQRIVGEGAATALGFGFVLLSPVYFAGLVFARSFRAAEMAAPALGANILGSVLGGWIEYGTMALGMRALVVLAAVLYLASLLALSATARRSTTP